LEAQLKPHGLTLRHFPQSFEWSTLGGWIATRSGGHFATLFTHIDEFVESVRVVTPRGVLETRRLPASGAGPSPERLFCGSEGTLGVITEAWMRVHKRPRFRAGASVYFADFAAAVRSPAASPTSIPTAPHPTTRSTRPGAPGRSLSNGTRSSTPLPRRSSRSAGRSRIIIRSDATIASGICASCLSWSPPPCRPRRPSSTRLGS
jgi:hypothetical protein